MLIRKFVDTNAESFLLFNTYQAFNKFKRKIMRCAIPETAYTEDLEGFYRRTMSSLALLRARQTRVTLGDTRARVRSMHPRTCSR